MSPLFPSLRLVRPSLFASVRGVRLGDLGGDVIAGLTLLAIAAPEQMATARLGGLAPQLGFLAFAAATAGFILFGVNRRLSVGADSTLMPIIAGSLALLALPGSAEYQGLMAVVALLTGVILLVGGTLRLGWVADLLSKPVLTGFLAGIAVHVALSQAPAFLGLEEEHGSSFARISALVAQAGLVNPWSLAIGAFVTVAIIASERLNPRIPGALIALALSAVAVQALGLEAKGVQVLGVLTAQKAQMHWPVISFNNLLHVVGLSFMAALVVMMQTAATSRSFTLAGEKEAVDQDFLGLGAANLVAGLFGTFAVNASPPRTAVAAEAGAKSQVSSLIAAASLILIGALAGGLFAHVPTAALAGVLMFVAMRIFHVQDFGRILATARGEFALAAATALLILALPIQTGVALGMFFSLIHGLFLTTQAAPAEFERVRGTTIWWPMTPGLSGERVPGVLVVGFQAPLSFLNAYEFRKGLLKTVKAASPGVGLVVLEAGSVVDIDYTASEILKSVIEAVRADGAQFAMARLESTRAQASLRRFGLDAVLGAQNQFLSVEAAITALAPHPSI